MTSEDVLHSLLVEQEGLVSELVSLTTPVPESGKASCTVMHQDRRLPSEYIVRVEVLDGEVPAVGGAGCRVGGDDVGVAIGGGVEGIAVVEFPGWDPGVGGVVPEGVVGGGVEGGGVAVLGADGEIEEVVVVVDPYVLDGAGALVFASLGVGGLDLVADLDLTDGFGFAVF
jgi:hypothetical protein